ncbi:MAG: glycosyltransferase family 2 protein [Woeseiaceae bacterium]|nr:glycosyltransferase family 2 protein [Woeseiaceae bacterium]
MKAETLQKPDISIVIPVYNEGANVAPLADEVFAALAGRLHYELIFVDDGSIDDTPDEVERMVRQDAAVLLCRHGRNRGQSAAVRTGVSAARADIVAVLDGDGQNDPGDLLGLFEQLRADTSVTMVIGERRKRQDSWLRRSSSKVANAVRSRLLGDGIRDTGCGIKVFYRDRYLDLPVFDHMHRFLPALIQRDGGKVIALPVNHRPRRHGVSKYGVGNRLWVGIMDMLGVRWLQKRRL